MKFKIKNKEVEISADFSTSKELFLIPTIRVLRDHWDLMKENNYFIEFDYLKYYFIIRFRIIKPF